MNTTTTSTVVYFFRRLLESSPEQFAAHLYHASVDELQSLLNTIDAYLSGKFPLNSRQIQMLKPYASVLREVCTTKNMEKLRTVISKMFNRDLILALADPLTGSANRRVHEAHNITTISSHYHKSTGNSGGSTKTGWTCEYCFKSGKTMRSYREHLNTHRKYCDLPFECNDCSKKYASSSALSRHKARYNSTKLNSV